MPLISRALIIALLCFAAVPAQGQRTMAAQQRLMPQVIGETEANARAVLRRYGIDTVSIIYTTIAAAAPGTVMGQKPAAQTPIAAGTRAVLFVVTTRKATPVDSARPGVPPRGSAPLPIAVPDLIGMNIDAATSSLAKIGLRPGAITSAPGEATPGSVVLQRPAAGQLVSLGSPVSLQYSTQQLVTAPVGPAPNAPVITSATPAGVPAPPAAAPPAQSPAVADAPPAGVIVPALAGHNLAEAIIALETIGLHIGTVDTVLRANGVGVIVLQQPAARTRVAAGARVAVTIARNSAAAIVPPTKISEPPRPNLWLWLLAAILALAVVGKVALDAMRAKPQVHNEAYEVLKAEAGSTVLAHVRFTHAPDRHTAIRFKHRTRLTRASLLPDGAFIMKEERTSA